MSKGDITLYSDGQFGGPGARGFVVASGTTASINAGEVVLKALGNSSGNVVSAMTTNKPVVATDFIAGISTTASNETASATGTVYVMPNLPGMTYVCAPKVASTWNTQAKYDALVGARVLIDVTSGLLTVLASDSANNGLVVEPLDIVRFPNAVRFSLRQALNYFA